MLPSSHRRKAKRVPAWSRAVQATLEREGWELMRHAFGNLAPLPPIPDRRWHPNFEELFPKSAVSTSGKIRWIPLFLQWLSVFGGFTLGLQIPRLQLRFLQAGSRRNSIAIDGALLHLGLAFVEWWKLVFERAQNHPGLSDEDRQVLRRVRESLGQFETGILQGSALKLLALRPLERFAWFRTSERELLLKTTAFERTANFFQRLGGK